MIAQIVYIDSNKTYTDSLKLAEAFDKEHAKVLRKIEQQLTEYPADFTSSHFWVDVRQVEIGQGATRDSKYYRLTRDGFMAVAMTFTGKKAAAFRVAVLDQFNQMEQQLIGVGIKTDRLSIAELLDLTSAELKKEKAGRLKAEGTVVYLKDNAVTNAKLNGYVSKHIVHEYPQSVPMARAWAKNQKNADKLAEFNDAGIVTVFLKKHGVNAFDLVATHTKGTAKHRFDKAAIEKFFKESV